MDIQSGEFDGNSLKLMTSGGLNTTLTEGNSSGGTNQDTTGFFINGQPDGVVTLESASVCLNDNPLLFEGQTLSAILPARELSISIAPKTIDELRTDLFEPISTKLSEDLPECILLRKGSPKLNENYYELNCNVCDSLFAVIETKVCRNGRSPLFYCPICQDVRRHSSDVYKIIPRTYMDRPYYDSCILV